MLVAILILVIFAAGIVTGWAFNDRYNEREYWDDDPAPIYTDPGGVFYTNTASSGGSYTYSISGGGVGSTNTFSSTGDVVISDKPAIDEEDNDTDN